MNNINRQTNFATGLNFYKALDVKNYTRNSLYLEFDPATVNTNFNELLPHFLEIVRSQNVANDIHMIYCRSDLDNEGEGITLIITDQPPINDHEGPAETIYGFISYKLFTRNGTRGVRFRARSFRYTPVDYKHKIYNIINNILLLISPAYKQNIRQFRQFPAKATYHVTSPHLPYNYNNGSGLRGLGSHLFSNAGASAGAGAGAGGPTSTGGKSRRSRRSRRSWHTRRS